MSSSILPDCFAYLRDIVPELSQMWFSNQLSEYIQAIRSDSDAFDRIVQAYKEIEQRDDCHRLNQWLNDTPDGATHGSPARGVLMLLNLFSELRARGIAPFTNSAISYQPILDARDWSLLPQQFSFVAGPAEAYGVRVIEQGFDCVTENLSEHDMEQLREVADKLNRDHAGIALQQWMDTLQGKEPELYALNCFLQLVDELGLLSL